MSPQQIDSLATATDPNTNNNLMDSPSPPPPPPLQSQNVAFFTELPADDHCGEDTAEVLSDVDTCSTNNKIQRRCSSASLQSLEEIVTCSIHLGLLVDPRLLPCGHAFCMACLEECLQRVRSPQAPQQQEAWRCPLCRHQCGSLSATTVKHLPRAGTHNYVIQYIANRRLGGGASSSSPSKPATRPPRPQRSFSDSSCLDDEVALAFCGANSGHSRRNSVKGDAAVRAEILQQMIQDLTQQKDVLGRGSENHERYIETLRSLLELLTPSSSTGVRTDTTPSAPDISAMEVTEESVETSTAASSYLAPPLPPPQVHHQSSPFSSAYNVVDMDTIRKNMKRHSAYRILQRISANVGELEFRVTEIQCADLLVDLLSQSSSSGNSSGSSSGAATSFQQAILLNANTPRPSFILRQHSSEKVRLKQMKREWTPIHVQCLRGLLYVLVLTAQNTLQVVLCTPDLHAIHQSRGVPVRPNLAENMKPTCGSQGFFLDPDRNHILLPLPWEGEVMVLNLHTLQEEGESLQFHGHHPSFVTRHPQSGELWISCPQDGTILIYEEDTGHVQKLGTENIYSAVPSDIITTTEGRIIFLDSHQNRLFWIRKRHDYILVQRLDFHGALRNSLLTGLRALSDNRVLISAHHGAFVAKPLRCLNPAKESGGNGSTSTTQGCTLL